MGADHRPCQFLKEVVLFIGALGRTEKCDAVRSRLIPYPLEGIRRNLQGLIPGHLAELIFFFYEGF